MGLDEFSMTATEIASTRYNVRNLNYKECQKLAKQICIQSTTAEVMDLINNFMNKDK